MKKYTVIGLTSLFLFGCAGVEFYTDDELTEETGFKYYNSIPYVLVSRTGSPTKPVDISIVYLPDLNSPVYARFQPGIGSHNFTFTLEDGQIKSYGFTTDAKLPETLNAITAPLSGVAGAIRTLAEAEKLEAEADALEEQSLDTEKIALIRSETEKLADGLSQILFQAAPLVPSIFTAGEKDDIEAFANRADQIADTFDSPQGPDIVETFLPELKQFREILRRINITPPSSDEAAQRIKRQLDAEKIRLTRIINEIDPPVAPATFQLYEIALVGGTTVLRQVDLP